MEQKQEQKQELKKNLGAVTAMATVVGSVIGSGVFFKPQAIYTATGGAPGLGMYAWLITGIVSIAAALTFSEVAIMIPKTGGIVAYLEEIYNPMIGFLAGWVQILLFYPAMISALAVAGGQQMAFFIGDGYVAPVAVAMIIIIIFLNSMGSKIGGSVQVIFTVCKMIPLILLMIFGFVRGASSLYSDGRRRTKSDGCSRSAYDRDFICIRRLDQCRSNCGRDEESGKGSSCCHRWRSITDHGSLFYH